MLVNLYLTHIVWNMNYQSYHIYPSYLYNMRFMIQPHHCQICQSNVFLAGISFNVVFMNTIFVC